MSTNAPNEIKEPTYYELERESLISTISDNLGKLIASMNSLNRKMEANVQVGNEFTGVSRLWREYERVMAHTGEEKLPSTIPIPTTADDSMVDARPEVMDESFGLAPGAGSTSYMP